jgi:hypothetical protein
MMLAVVLWRQLQFTQQLFQLTVFPCAQMLDRVSAEVLE